MLSLKCKSISSIALCWAWAWGTNTLVAQSPSARPATFARVDIGARAGAMGDAHVAAAEGVEAIYWNPAALLQLNAAQVALMQRRLPFDRNFTFLGAALPVGTRFTVATSWSGFKVSDIEVRRGNTLQPEAYFGNTENAFALGIAFNVSPWLAAGFGVRYLSQQFYEHRAMGYGVAAGVLLHPATTLRVGVSLQDFVSNFKWHQSFAERLPQTLRLGLAWQPFDYALVAIDYDKESVHSIFAHKNWQAPGEWHVGFEFFPNSLLPVRLGWGAQALAAGAGLEIEAAGHQLIFDYHFAVQDGINQSLHSFTLAFAFGGKAQREHDDKNAAKQYAHDSRSYPNSSQSDKRWLRVNAAVLRVRSGPGTNYEQLHTVKTGERFRIVRESDKWLQIELHDRRGGWVHRDYVTIESRH